MIRRYVGRATGARRRSKRSGFYPWPFWSLPTLFIATGAMTAVLVAVLIINPGSHIPSEAKGTQPPAGVTPTTTSHPPVSKPAGSSSAPAVGHKTKPTASPSVTPTKASPSPAPTTPKPTHSTTPPPKPKVYSFVVRDDVDDICKIHEDPKGWTGIGTGTKYWSDKNNGNPDDAFAHKRVDIPDWIVKCDPVPPPSDPPVVP